MSDIEDQCNEAIEDGKQNLRVKQLLSNWCLHAGVKRLGGIGMIEAETGLPIGHMSVQCKHAAEGSNGHYLLEDSIYSFYKNNCTSCKERVPVAIPNIMDFIGPRENAYDRRARENEEEQKKKQQHLDSRQKERTKLRHELSLEETFALDLLDELDQEDAKKNDPRLEELANLAPETFTKKVVEYLFSIALDVSLPYSRHTAKALLRAPLDQEKKLSVAVRLVSGYHDQSSNVIDTIISNAEKLSQSDLIKVLRHLALMAVRPPPGTFFGGTNPIKLNSKPINSLFQKRPSEICIKVGSLLNDSDPGRIQAAIEIILAIDNDELLSNNIRSILAKLMRRQTLLQSEKKDSPLIYYLREAASKCLKFFPEKTDNLIQSFLADRNNIGLEEALKIYNSVLQQKYNEDIHIGDAQRVAFKRLLWAAVENPDNWNNDSVQFFTRSYNKITELATEHFDDLIGAAATLSKKYEQIATTSPIELTNNSLTDIEKNNQLSTIDRLQRSLIEWAAVGAKSKGREGIEEYLKLYNSLPGSQVDMRGNMTLNISRLLSDVGSLSLVLSDWYHALMDENTLVRTRGVQAWEYVPRHLIKSFPDLYFEALSVLLTDPYIMVHKSAVRSLRRNPIPREKRHLINPGLWSLTLSYSKQSKKDDFVVECIGALIFLCLSREEIKTEFGRLFSSILLNLEGGALYESVNQLHRDLKYAPNFTKVALKSIQDDYTRSISIDHCISSILSAPNSELKNCIDEVKTAFKALKPFKARNFIEALLYINALTKAGDYETASTYTKELLESIPKESQNEIWQNQAALVAAAAEIENKINAGDSFEKLIIKWQKLSSTLTQKKNEKRNKFGYIPSSF